MSVHMEDLCDIYYSTFTVEFQKKIDKVLIVVSFI